MATVESVGAQLELKSSFDKPRTCPIPPEAPATTVELKVSYFYMPATDNGLLPHLL